MDKKLFIKNRPFDVNDANDMLNWTEAGIQNVIKSLYSYGIMSGMAVTVNSGLTVNIGTGTAFDSSFNFINVKTNQTATLSSADTTYPRYDKIVISYSASTVDNVDTANTYGMGTSLVYSRNKLDSYIIQVIKGTAASSPTVPATPAGALDLAQIYIPANNNTISAGNIGDLRSFARASNTNMLAASTSQAGTVQLTDSTTSTSITTAATPNSVKTVMDYVKNSGLGDVSKGTAADLNTLTSATGFYYSTGTLNRPVSSNGWVIVQVLQSTYVTQMYFSAGDGGVWIRSLLNGTWTAWKQLAITDVATQQVNGLMSATDKTKLDNMTQGLTQSDSPTFSSLTVNNDATIKGKVLAAEGTGAVGGYSFSLDGYQDTGMFSPADGDLRFYSNGQDVLDLSTTQVTAKKQVSAPNFISTIATGTAPFSVTSTTVVTNLNADTVDGYNLDQSVSSTGTPTFSSATVKNGLTVNNMGTGTQSGLFSGVSAAGNYLTGSVIGDTVIRNQANTNLLFGFQGATGSETSALKIGYNGGANKATVATQRNTLDDGTGNIILNSNATKVAFTDSSGHKVTSFTSQSDDNFVFYASKSDGTSQPVWSYFMNKSTTQTFTINVPTLVNSSLRTNNNTLDDGSGNVTVSGTFNGIKIGGSGSSNFYQDSQNNAIRIPDGTAGGFFIQTPSGAVTYLNAGPGYGGVSFPTGKLTSKNNTLDDGSGGSLFNARMFVQGPQSGAAIDSSALTLKAWNGTAAVGANIKGSHSGGWFSSNYADNAVTFSVTDSGYVTTKNNTLDDGNGNFTASGTINTSNASGDRRYQLNGKDVIGQFTGWNTNMLYINTNATGATENQSFSAGVKIKGAIFGDRNTLDDGSGNMSIGGNLTLGTNSIYFNGNADASILPQTGKSVGFTNRANNKWGLKVTDGTNPSTYTNNNTLDDGSGNATFRTVTSNVATGTAPFTVTSTTKVANLNVDMVDGYSADINISANTMAVRDGSGNINANSFISNIGTGTAPLTVTSTTKVVNLNVDQVDGYDFNQGVKTTDNVTFNNVSVSGVINIENKLSLTLQNGWVGPAAPYTPAAYRKDPMGFVHLMGRIGGGTATMGTIIATLPAAYAPRYRMSFPVVTNNGSDQIGQLDIDTSGNIIAMLIYNTYTVLDSVVFPCGGVDN